jgi:hypothetical protein
MPTMQSQKSVIRRAFERLTIGQLELKQFLSTFEVRDIRKHGAIECLNPRAGSALAKTLDRGEFTCQWVEQARIPCYARCRSTDSEVFVPAALLNDSFRPRVFGHLLFAFRVPPDVRDPPEVILLGVGVFSPPKSP